MLSSIINFVEKYINFDTIYLATYFSCVYVG